MRISQTGIDLIKQFEGFRSKAYICPAGVLTIGYGSTGKHVQPGMSINTAYGEKLLREDVSRFESAVNRLVTVPMSQGQFDALVSFAFNVGEGALAKSTLLRKLNAGDYAGAAHEFKRWNRGGGRVLAGLVRRREAEAKLFNS